MSTFFLLLEQSNDEWKIKSREYICSRLFIFFILNNLRNEGIGNRQVAGNTESLN